MKVLLVEHIAGILGLFSHFKQPFLKGFYLVFVDTFLAFIQFFFLLMVIFRLHLRLLFSNWLLPFIFFHIQRALHIAIRLL